MEALTFIKDKTECKICKQLMVDAKILKTCLHSFCKNCIETAMAGEAELTCPYCRVVTRQEEIKDDFNMREMTEVYKKAVDHIASSSPSCDDVYTRLDQDTSFEKELNLLKSKIKDCIAQRRCKNTRDEDELCKAFQNRKRRWMEAFDRASSALEAATRTVVSQDPKIAALDKLLRDVAEESIRSKAAVDEQASVEHSKQLHRKLLDFMKRTPKDSRSPLSKYLALYEHSGTDFDAAALCLMEPHCSITTGSTPSASALIEASHASSLNFTCTRTPLTQNSA